MAADRALGATLGPALTEDAYYLAPGRPVLAGRDAIVRALAPPAGRRAERTPLVAAVSADGSHGYTAGRLLEHPGAGDAPTHAKYLAYWRRDGGTWRVWAYVENPSPAAPDSAPAGPPLKPHRATSQSASADAAALLAADAQFSALSAADGAGPAFGRFAERGALLLLGGGHRMVWGDSAIAGFIGGAIPPPDRLTWTPRVGRLAPAGDLGFTIGDGTYRHVAPSGGEQRSYSKYLTVWRRQPDGAWRYAADAGNEQPAPGELRVEPVAGGIHLSNPDSATAFFTVFEQGLTALVNWRPCVELAGCRHVPGRGDRRLPFDSIPGYSPAADSAVVFWCRRLPAPGGRWVADSVRSVTIGLAGARAGR